MNPISHRVEKLDLSGIRRVFDLAGKLDNPINLSIGQPDFEVPDSIKKTASEAIFAGKNSYTPTQGMAELVNEVSKDSKNRGLQFEDAIITSGVSGGLFLAFSTLLNPGDEVLIPDPCFLMYRQLGAFLDAKVTTVNTYPSLKCTAEILEPYLNHKTKVLVLNTPSNPTGVSLSHDELKDMAELLKKYPHLTVIQDEIYRLFTYDQPHQSLSNLLENVITLDGLSKSHAMTGWRVGWALGPQRIIQQMAKLQQFTFVCSPSMAQVAAIQAMRYSMTDKAQLYAKKRDLIYEGLKDHFDVVKPDGAFYIFPKVPDSFKNSQSFVESALEKNVLIIPGHIFSNQDTHFRISFAASDETLRQGIEVLTHL